MALALRASYSTPANNPSPKQQTGVVVVANDLIIVGWRADADDAATSCADNAAGGTNTYNQLGTGQYFATATGNMRIFYAIAKASETLTVTITASTGAYSVILVHVVSGANPVLASVLDTHAFATHTTNTALTSASIVTTNANDYIFTWWSQDATNSINITDNTTPAFTERQENTNWSTGGPSTSFDKIVSATGTYSQTVSLSATSPEISVIAAFKAGAATPVISSFTATPANVDKGSSSDLAWTVTDYTSLSINQGIGTVTASPYSVSPTATKTYTLTATNANGNSEAIVTVGVIDTAFQPDSFQNNAFQIYASVPYNATSMLALF